MTEHQQHAEEQHRHLSADFQEVFATSAGQRVLSYILNNLLLDKTTSLSFTQQGAVFPNADRGMYFVALSDVAKNIKGLMDYDFTRRQQRPVVHNRRPVQRPEYLNRGQDE